MAKIIKLDTSRKKTVPPIKLAGICGHKNVRVSEVKRTVRCVYCGELLDPFEVLVDMVKGYIPGDTGNSEEIRLLREVEKRHDESQKEDQEPE